jgi:DNA-binding IclR family transcriptional regulator
MKSSEKSSPRSPARSAPNRAKKSNITEGIEQDSDAKSPDSIIAAPGSDALGKGGASVFARSFGVLEYVVRIGRPVLPAEIADHLDLPKPTVYRMIEQFEALGFLYRPFSSRRISVGPRLNDLAFDILRYSVQYAPRRQILQGLVDEVGETCNIGTLEGGQIVYFDRVEATRWPLRLNFHIGSRVPLHCTAIGKLFLAFLPDAKRTALLKRLDFVPYTAHTLTTPAALEDELVRIRHERLSVDREEYLAGVVCIAAPVFNARGEITAGIAIQAPAARMPVTDAYRHRVALIAAARSLTDSFITTPQSD